MSKLEACFKQASLARMVYPSRPNENLRMTKTKTDIKLSVAHYYLANQGCKARLEV